MNILESVGTGVGMGRHGRYDHHVPFAVVQTAVIEQEGAGAIGAVYKFPAFMGMPGNRVDDGVLADISDVVHADSFQIQDS